MRIESRAALVSALVFPGAGQLLVLRRPKAGLCHLVLAATSLGVLLLAAGLRAFVAAQGLAEAGPSLEAFLAVAAAAWPSADLPTLTSLFVFLGTWIYSTVDALRTEGR